MAETTRVFYIGKGEEIEASPDEGETWEKYTKCKTVDYGGNTYVWPPAGKTWEWKKLAVKHPVLQHIETGRPMMQLGQSIPVVTGDAPGKDSYLDLDMNETRAAFRLADKEGLVLEPEYRKRLDPEELRRRAEMYLAEAEALEGPKKNTKRAANR